MDTRIKPVELAKAYRLINHGPTVLVSSRYAGTDDVMAAAWCCALDVDPPKLTVVLESTSKTRSLIEAGGEFVVQIPTVKQVELTRYLGTHSLGEQSDKLARSGVGIFDMPERNQPFVAGCSGWLACKIVREPHIQKQYDLFIADVDAAWADERVFSEGHWHFETADPGWRSIHHVAGGHFYAIGQPVISD
ncbi:flavin reductase family protein [Rhizobium calliandrae]|uniref:Flavin reductase family protein n=1 Tax=Rhizobium calliandrae TaxID=1312182 RepID=A0ABT7KHU3_9HYPH|nr:flavin reductase family protein [Rhizobium calliandrae]MDL2408210.1 flavin reductase family protein [Rhizobium calliandrae]